MKKSLILTNEEDYSSTEVIKWLIYQNKKFTRINANDSIDVLQMQISNNQESVKLRCKGELIDSNDYRSFWYRRGDLNIAYASDVRSGIPGLNDRIGYHLQDEGKALNNYIHLHFERKRSINSKFTARLNKLYTLSLAKRVGLKVPETRIINSKDELLKLLAKAKLITKGIQEGITFQVYNKKQEETLQYSCMTSEFKRQHLNRVSNQFPPTKFQSKIEKRFELRVFYFNKRFFSMAIFSQSNARTAVDFRNYDFKKPNRCVPYKLPKVIEKKLSRLFNLAGLNSGSADLIVDSNNEYVFLEINPIGQFGMVSKPCNYYLEREIARYL